MGGGGKVSKGTGLPETEKEEGPRSPFLMESVRTSHGGICTLCQPSSAPLLEGVPGVLLQLSRDSPPKSPARPWTPAPAWVWKRGREEERATGERACGSGRAGGVGKGSFLLCDLGQVADLRSLALDRKWLGGCPKTIPSGEPSPRVTLDHLPPQGDVCFLTAGAQQPVFPSVSLLFTLVDLCPSMNTGGGGGTHRQV